MGETSCETCIIWRRLGWRDGQKIGLCRRHKTETYETGGCGDHIALKQNVLLWEPRP
jgi:hypothetical protein